MLTSIILLSAYKFNIFRIIAYDYTILFLLLPIILLCPLYLKIINRHVIMKHPERPPLPESRALKKGIHRLVAKVSGNLDPVFPLFFQSIEHSVQQSPAQALLAKSGINGDEQQFRAPLYATGMQRI
jgi:hypothetical protein